MCIQVVKDLAESEGGGEEEEEEEEEEEHIEALGRSEKTEGR